MTKPKQRPARVVDAVQDALDRKTAERPDDLKPIEIVKTVICAYQEHTNAVMQEQAVSFESPDKSGLRRGTQVAVDRLLFNANYWLAAYEDHIIAACEAGHAALLEAVTVWNGHTLKLNTLDEDDVVSTFERFCPPFATNKRRGGEGRGSGPIAAFEMAVKEQVELHPESAEALAAIASDMRAEAAAYEAIPSASPLDALYAILPVWCLQDKIALVSGGWWDEPDVVMLLASALKRRFIELGHGDAPCRYFYESIHEAVDEYQLNVDPTGTSLSGLKAPELVNLVHAAREANPGFESDGYGNALPAWLVSKEQLVWNILVCAIYGPGAARPSFAASPGPLTGAGLGLSQVGNDAITVLAKSSFRRYSLDRSDSGSDRGYRTFADMPQELRDSSIEYVKSFHDKLKILGYEAVPDGSCYPSQKITELTPSEVECLAILEHRRWLGERTQLGWVYGEERDVEKKTSPYLVLWEELPDRAREWNRSAIRNIPALLAGEGLAIARKQGVFAGRTHNEP